MKRHATVGLSLLLAACASTPAGAVDPGIGRRAATVVQVGNSASFGPWQENDCRRVAGTAARDGQRYASVQYFSGRHAHLRIVPIDDDRVLAVGDPVIVRTHGCTDTLTR